MEGIKIPLAKTTFLLPDEDLWTEEEVIPELYLYNISNKMLYRQFIHSFYNNKNKVSPHWWHVINTCQSHNNQKSLRSYNDLTSRNFVRSLKSEIVFSQEDLKNPKGVSINFPL